ncbi:hypothetical protein PMI07_003974 [Rhizobium sp. CF080]|uniref:hypothetical protein n=1 Tax=Rhizobium sp. (strain CF080) TaxID=1144310 RepID=UPI000271A34D|nr:hypothetical protein [Rhizobium sp. CF080]EUC00688.1 hypothetical protein PMI07_003974 [Rhizobium sp. CF080]
MIAAEAAYTTGRSSVTATPSTIAARAGAAAAISGAADITGIPGAAASRGASAWFDDIEGQNDPEGDESRKYGSAEQSVRSDGVHDSLSF